VNFDYIYDNITNIRVKSAAPNYLLLPAHASCSCCSCILGLHLQYCTEQGLRRGGQELNLSVRVQAVQVGRLRGQAFVDVRMVALAKLSNTWQPLKSEGNER
jgi:hypothetical protein